jgi:hypothetical protein
VGRVGLGGEALLGPAGTTDIQLADNAGHLVPSDVDAAPRGAFQSDRPLSSDSEGVQATRDRSSLIPSLPGKPPKYYWET